VYTPTEIVRFMIESADWLCQKHFGKSLIDKQVEILDPAAGTGTFITELIEHFRGQPAKLRYKYLEELHANEVAILPYYVANLNIETTYATINGYEEYPNLCFVDTLDNTAGLGIFSGYQHEMFGAIAEENIERIKRQNKKKISVVIGNPPYNAWQENYNSRNPNRPYKRVDERIAITYVSEGTAKNKNSVYDMYTRFFRWASDRIKDEGLVAFITGRKPFVKGAYDGFRKVIAREFAEIWILDLGGDVRDNPKISGTKHNVFGIQTGVAIAFCIKKKGKGNAVIHYARRPEMETKDDKLDYLASTKSIGSVNCSTVQPDRQHYWLGQTQNDWSGFPPIVASTTGTVASRGRDQSIFALASNGVETKRDEWTYDLTRASLMAKIRFFIAAYERRRRRSSEDDKGNIKWDRELDKHLRRNIEKKFDPELIRSAEYRPFSRRLIYYDRHLNAFHFQTGSIFPDEQPHPTIVFSDPFAQKPWFTLATGVMVDRHFVGAAAASICASRFRWSKDGACVDNITDWAADQFHRHFESGKSLKRSITKDAIFHYVYGVLHDPLYREKYALNLKREFPRIPFYENFWRWAEWGEKLLTLHIGYETVEPWPLKRIDAPDEKSRKAGLVPKAVLRADKEAGSIQLDSETQLTGVPPEAWAYRLGNRSALEWILDQHKEKTPKDPTIREKFNTYRFLDHKEKVIDLLMRVTRVSVETMKIVEAMRIEKR
jgi:predicted helicase